MRGQFPSEWLQLHLGDTVEYGKALKAKADEIEDDTWVLELEDIEKNTSVILKKIIFKDRQTKSTKNKFKKGDVLYGKLRPYLNKVVIAEEDGVCSTEILPLSGNTGLNNKYLFYWLKHPTFLEYVTKVGYGVNMPRLGTKDGKSAPFTYAPLTEQKEIATQLDNLLTQVDTLKNRLDTIPALLKRFRQSVLAAAVSGKLTEDWRENTNNINNINFSQYEKQNLYLNKSSFEIAFPCNWKINKLIDSCQIISGNAFKSKDFIEREEAPVIKISNVQYGAFEVKNQQYLPSFFIEEYSKFLIVAGDILMALTRPITNDTLKICRYPTSSKTGLLNQRVCKFEFTNETEKLFFELLFQSDYFKVQVKDNLSETLQPNLSPTSLKKFIVAIPCEEEQTEIITRVESLLAFADKIETRLKQAQIQANNLTPSLLAKAFRGDLTAEWRKQNPELITGENSAKALLERIKAEQEKLIPKPKARKKKA